jgi:hypothetical protein
MRGRQHRDGQHGGGVGELDDDVEIAVRPTRRHIDTRLEQ